MLMKPARILAITVGIAMLIHQSVYATGLDSASFHEPSPATVPMVRLPGHVLPALAKATRIKSAPHAGDSPITLTLTLNRDDQAGFERYLHQVYDRRSPNFHQFLKPQEISDRFGPSQQDYDAVLGYLRQHGFKLIEGSKNRMTITVRGTRIAAERTFDIELDQYRLGKKSFYANDRNPAMPASIANRVAAVSGLSDYTRPVRNVAIAKAFCALVASLLGLGGILKGFKIPNPTNASGGILILVGICAITVWLWQACYNFEISVAKALGCVNCSKPGPQGADAQVVATPITGAGQTIGLIEFDTYQPSDVSDYATVFNSSAVALGPHALDATNVTNVHVNGGATSGPNQDEVLLDIDAVMTVAPGAKVVVYDAPFAGAGGSFQPVLNKMISDGVTIISNSWAYCEDQTTAADVQSIDTLLQSAAAAGISVFTGAGDSGSTCLDGTPNTLGVPADSPNVTAVGGSSLTIGNGITYGGETWWNGTTSTPQTGEGGFGVSKFFTRPAYQNGLNLSPMRSVPDVVAAADPAKGTAICHAGNCPDGLSYAGTSLAAPFWAAATALLNQEAGQNFGFLNPLIYPLANTSAFHTATSLSSDFDHVGLGSPNFDQLFLKLTNQTVGAASATTSLVATFSAPQSFLFLPDELGVSADGSASGVVVVRLLDANMHAVGGKTISLAANGGSSAQITPPSGVSSFNDGSVVFNVTDLTSEDVTFTATDESDGITLDEKPLIPFVVPLAASAGIGASPSTIAADGTSTSTITVTLKDSLNRATPGKLVTLDQGNGHSVVDAPNPSVTDGTGKVQFAATNLTTESVTYTASDESDGGLPVPGSATVSFTSGAGTGCAPGPLIPAGGSPFSYTNFVTGFPTASQNCLNPAGMAFDSENNLYVADYAGYSSQGGLYKFPPSGGVAGPAYRLNASPYASGTCASGLAFSKDGKHLYMARQGCNGDVIPGDVVEVSTTDGSVLRTLATLDCASGLATDPISGDLFVSQPCPRGSSNISRISNPNSGSPTTSIYSNGVGGAADLVFTPDGTLWTEAYRFDQGIRHITRIDGTNSASPGSFTYLIDAFSQSSGVLPALNPGAPGDPPFLLAVNGNAAPGSMSNLSLIDLTQNPPTQNDIFTGGPVAVYIIAGRDGCAYVAETDRIVRIANADGTCPFAPSAALPAVSLSPADVSPNPVQGSLQAFTATLVNVSSPAGTPIFFTVGGSNNQVRMATADANGQASFRYSGLFTGTDKVTASFTANSNTIASNTVDVTWEPGQDTAFLSLNLSPKGCTPGNPVNLIASLTDVSQQPAVAIVGQTVMLGLGSDTCSASTDVHGNASCSVNPVIIPGSPSRTITADFAGNSNLTSAHASSGFMFTAPPEDAKLKVTPNTLHFPAEVELGGVGAASKPLKVNVFNPKSKKQKLTVTFLGAENSGDFAIVSGPPTTCDVMLNPKQSCKIALTFSPTGTGKRTGTLMVIDNAEINNAQMVKLVGHGHQGALTISTGTLSFGKQAVNTPSNPKFVKVANRNPIAMSFSAATSGDYQITSGADACPASSLPPKTACKVYVTFTPTATGSRPGELTFTDDALKSPQHVNLTGTGK
jgi:hypothetical protein